MYVDSKTAMRFQSTHPVRGATRAELLARNEYVFQSTHPVRGARDNTTITLGNLTISIHAPREGCDRHVFPSSHCNPFQSTHPVRGATTLADVPRATFVFQSTHPVRGANCYTPPLVYEAVFQSTHPVRGATRPAAPVLRACLFQSTHPVRGAIGGIAGRRALRGISIHAPREGCD